MSKFSPLMDPLVLDTDVATSMPAIWDKFPKINWTSSLINFIIPGVIFLFLAFTLKSRYDRKKKLHDEYLVV